MSYQPEKVMIVGGTGFLGFYSALEFLKRRIPVSSVSIPDVELGEWFPPQLHIFSQNFDVFTASEEDLCNVFDGYDVVVYAVGPDDRITPPAPAYDFFYDRLVSHCSIVAKAARKSGVKRLVVMNSYFTYFNKVYHGQLAQNHPYIMARVLQAAEFIAAGEAGEMDVMILQLPYIFGSMPGREPLWKKVFLDRFAKMPVLPFPGGGTVMIHVRGVAQAVVAATINGEHGKFYPIGLTNMKFKKMIESMYGVLGMKKKVLTVGSRFASLGAEFLKRAEARHGRQAGLDYPKLMSDIQSKDFYYDQELIEEVQQSLGFAELDFEPVPSVEEGIVSTMKACYPERFPGSDPAAQFADDLAVIDKVWMPK
ncbi:MAG: NAD(P)-dependent oxidoreductase [Spirochaetales bacterium]|nr:NAD(P)-dependent oxidoreductase [Spirochaetales bacterium]